MCIYSRRGQIVEFLGYLDAHVIASRFEPLEADSVEVLGTRGDFIETN